MSCRIKSENRVLSFTLALLLFVLFPLALTAQEQEPADSIVRLIRADRLQSVEKENATCRKAFGTPENQVTFLHNNTYLLCDTAYWYVDLKKIDAFGHVKLLQEQTQLTSDKLIYLVDEDLAQFRGSLVQLQDDENNLLRTRFLDYNTKDSVAIFRRGASMRDKDGQLIESEDGTYDSKAKIFDFRNNVNMFTDSIFIKTASLQYESERNFATFGYATDVWSDKNMLSADAGWYNRKDSVFFFRRHVHFMNEQQEGWCDSLYYYQPSGDLIMRGNVQVTDTTRSLHSLAGKMVYRDSLSMVSLYRDPAVMVETQADSTSAVDSLWFGADTMIYYTIHRYALSDGLKKVSQARLEGINVDPVGELRKKAAEAKAQADAKAAEEDPNSAAAAAKRREAFLQAQKKAKEQGDSATRAEGKKVSADSLKVGTDSLKVGADSLKAGLDSLRVVADSLKTKADSLKNGADSLKMAPKDSTKIGFLRALRNVRLYRKNMQVSCDSLEYNDIDSLARLYLSPYIWNEVNHQYTADSMYVLVRNSAMEKANLISNSFIIIREDTLHYNQIKATESVAYFKDNQLQRYDGLGGANALFYIEEDGELATVNTKEAKILSATFKDETLEKVYYFETPKSNAYPVCQMTKDDQRLKGFNWDESKRPRSREDVSRRYLRPSQRKSYSAHPMADYPHSEKYFPGYIKGIHKQIAIGDSLERVRARQQRQRDSLAREARIDSLAKADSLTQAKHLSDSLSRVDSLAKADSIKKETLHLAKEKSDSLARVKKDSVARHDSAKVEVPLTKKELREKKKAECKARREARRKAAEEKRLKREQEREARWLEMDKRDSIKQARREQKKKERERKKKYQQLLHIKAQEAREEQKIQQYMEEFRRPRAPRVQSEEK